MESVATNDCSLTIADDELTNLMVAPGELADLKHYANSLPSLQLSERAVCDLELLATGAFSPLDRFMDQKNYQRVLDEGRLENGRIFPIPVTLPVELNRNIRPGRDITLRTAENDILAVMTVEEIFEWAFDEVAEKVFGTEDLRHPLIAEMHRWGRYHISGPIQVLQLPRHYDFLELRLTPLETRSRLKSVGRKNVVAFQTRNPLHRVHEELTRRAIQEKDGVLLLHPAVGMTKPGDVNHYSRVRTYKALAANYYEPGRVLLSILPLAMRMAGPREALWHAVIRRNYGVNYLIVGRDHASPGVDSMGRPFYEPYAAQEMVEKYSEETGVGVVPFQELVYLSGQDRYVEANRVPVGEHPLSISGTLVREEYLGKGKRPPGWLVRPEVAEILCETYPPRHRQGLCVWFTGLSGAGKSSTAAILTVLLMEHHCHVTLLDGDVVRTHLSTKLGFSREDRDINVRRIGFVAGEIVRHGGVVVCAVVSPYRAARNDVRSMVGSERFIEVFMDTTVEVCEQRDTKGLYARARAGEIKGLTGIDDPYEPPINPEITLDPVSASAEENARKIMSCLIEHRFVQSNQTTDETAY